MQELTKLSLKIFLKLFFESKNFFGFEVKKKIQAFICLRDCFEVWLLTGAMLGQHVRYVFYHERCEVPQFGAFFVVEISLCNFAMVVIRSLMVAYSCVF